MKRRDFFKRIGIGAAAVVATPSLLGSIKEEPKQVGVGTWEQIREENIHPHYAKYSMPLFVTTTKPTKISEPGDAIEIHIDECLRIGDVVYIPPQYTNKDILSMYMVTQDLNYFRVGGAWDYKIMPLDGTNRVAKSIRKGIKLEIGPNLVIENKT